MLDRITYISDQKDGFLCHLNNETDDLLKNVGVKLVLNKIHNRYVPIKICPDSFIMRDMYQNNIDDLYTKLKEMSKEEISNLIKSNSAINKFNL